ncbi:hypothetical protein BH23ACT6_BH23ACT6_09870 [soil metagenome]
MTIRYPAPLHHGDRVGITACSAGVPETMRARYELAVAAVQDRGYEVVTGQCLEARDPARDHVSAPVADRAAELMTMLTDPRSGPSFPRGAGRPPSTSCRCWTGIGCGKPSRPG